MILAAFEVNGDTLRIHEVEAEPEQSDDEAVPDSVNLFMLEAGGAVVFSASKLSAVILELQRRLLLAGA